MQFIEAFFGISPDNNTGATETAILLALCFGITSVRFFSRRYKRAKAQRTSQ